VRAIAQICHSETADNFAVWARTALLEILFQEGRLDKWREHDNLNEKLFEVAASFPLPQGLNGFDAQDFLASLPV
jgi:hypothetical protein